MSFKTRNKKKSLQEQRVTLQAKHNDKIKEFDDLKNIQIFNQEKLKEANKKYEAYKNIKNSSLSDEELENKLELEDTIRELEKAISSHNSNKFHDVDYLLDTGSILFSYYNQMNEKTKKTSIKNKPIPQKKDIIHFFKKQTINVKEENKPPVLKKKNF